MMGANSARPGLVPLAALFVVMALLAGCSDVKDTRDGANEGRSSILNADAEPRADGEGNAQIDSMALDAIYDEGVRLRKAGSDDQAFERFREAAEAGHGPAAFELGEAYNEGRGVEQDLDAGAKWINAAATRGEPRAQYRLGAAYYSGNSVARDYARAVDYLTDAADQNYAPAQFLLAECYANGRGVTKNLSWAARWYGKAAEQGYAKGVFSYGVVHAAGLGVPSNLAAGYAWLSVADKLGHGTAKDIRAAIVKDMSPAQLEAGKAQANDFTATGDAPFADKPTTMFVQHSLNRLGFNAGAVDGLSGPRTRSAIGAYLKSVGDGGAAEITPELVRRLFESQQNTV